MKLKITAAQANAISAREYGSESLDNALAAGMTYTGSIRGRIRENGHLTIPETARARIAAANFFANFGQLSVDALQECDFAERGEYVAMRNVAIKVGEALGIDLLENVGFKTWELAQVEAYPSGETA